MNRALGQPGSDIQDVDFKDDKQLEAWIRLLIASALQCGNSSGDLSDAR